MSFYFLTGPEGESSDMLKTGVLNSPDGGKSPESGCEKNRALLFSLM